MSDIVERLRGVRTKDYGCKCPKCEAADEIERLRAELAAAIKQREEAVRDAERYRWLKSGGCYWVEIQSQPSGDYIFKGQAARSLGGSIDNAIDAAIAAMRKGDSDGK